MIKYYTRACNFFYCDQAKKLIKNKTGLPLCGNDKIAFTSLEIFSRKKKYIKSKFINIKEIKHLKKNEIFINIDLFSGRGESKVWTCDLTKEYININADYRS